MLTIQEASKEANVSEATIRNWAKDFVIGIKVGGKWQIDIEKLAKVLKGEIHYPFRYEKRNKKCKNKK